MTATSLLGLDLRVQISSSPVGVIELSFGQMAPDRLSSGPAPLKTEFNNYKRSRYRYDLKFVSEDPTTKIVDSE